MIAISRRAAFLALLAVVTPATADTAEARAGRAVSDDCDTSDDDSCRSSAAKKGGK